MLSALDNHLTRERTWHSKHSPLDKPTTLDTKNSSQLEYLNVAKQHQKTLWKSTSTRHPEVCLQSVKALYTQLTYFPVFSANSSLLSRPCMEMVCWWSFSKGNSQSTEKVCLCSTHDTLHAANIPSSLSAKLKPVVKALDGVDAL